MLGTSHQRVCYLRLWLSLHLIVDDGEGEAPPVAKDTRPSDVVNITYYYYHYCSSALDVCLSMPRIHGFVLQQGGKSTKLAYYHSIL